MLFIIFSFDRYYKLVRGKKSRCQKDSGLYENMNKRIRWSVIP